jgi:hypothetical protein
VPVKKKGTDDRKLVRARGAYGRAKQLYGEDSTQAQQALNELRSEQRRRELHRAHAVIAAAYAEDAVG